LLLGIAVIYITGISRPVLLISVIIMMKITYKVTYGMKLVTYVASCTINLWLAISIYSCVFIKAVVVTTQFLHDIVVSPDKVNEWLSFILLWELMMC